MKYLVAEFRIDCANDMAQIAKDLLADMAGEAGFESFEDTDGGLNGYVQESAFDEEQLNGSLRDFPIDNVQITYNINKVEDHDWNEEWERQGFEPIAIGDKIVVYDAKRQADAATVPASATAIAIDARQAFGTGTHQTTRMVISSLMDTDVKGKHVLDCGCGTGILSIAAAKLGAADCTGYDIDEWSVDNSRHNAELNHVGNLHVLQGDAALLDRYTEQFDIVMANINRNILIADMPKFALAMRKGGQLLLSGFYMEDVEMLKAKAESLGLKYVGVRNDGDWACLAFQKAGF